LTPTTAETKAIAVMSTTGRTRNTGTLATAGIPAMAGFASNSSDASKKNPFTVRKVGIHAKGEKPATACR
jgi:hypothetical protein